MGLRPLTLPSPGLPPQRPSRCLRAHGPMMRPRPKTLTWCLRALRRSRLAPPRRPGFGVHAAALSVA
eukprot:9145169-Prorocentrum_lima.AAC.1